MHANVMRIDDVMDSHDRAPERDDGGLDPRTKLLLTLLSCFVVFTAPLSSFSLVFMGLFCILFIIERMPKLVFELLAVYVGIMCLAQFIIPVLPAQVGVMLAVICYGGVIFPCAVAAVYLVKTTSVGQFVAALRAIHIPNTLIVALTATLRFFPAIREDFSHVRDASRLRKPHGLQRRVDCIYVPLLLSVSSTAADLAASVTARGIDNPCQKTSWHRIGFSAGDAIVLAVALAIYAACIAWRVMT